MAELFLVHNNNVRPDASLNGLVSSLLGSQISRRTCVWLIHDWSTCTFCCLRVFCSCLPFFTQQNNFQNLCLRWNHNVLKSVFFRQSYSCMVHTLSICCFDASLHLCEAAVIRTTLGPIILVFIICRSFCILHSFFVHLFIFIYK